MYVTNYSRGNCFDYTYEEKPAIKDITSPSAQKLAEKTSSIERLFLKPGIQVRGTECK